MLSEGFAQRLRARMSRLGIQANELAEKIGVTPGAVGNWMSGGNEAKGRNLRKLAGALNCDAMWLSHGESESMIDPMVLHETAAPSETEIWKRRALKAENKLEQLRVGLRFLQAVGSDTPVSNSITPAEAASIVDKIEALADQDPPGGPPPSAPVSLQPPDISQGSKKPNVP